MMNSLPMRGVLPFDAATVPELYFDGCTVIEPMKILNFLRKQVRRTFLMHVTFI